MKKAFTMIELIFVIIVLGILAGIAVSRYLPLITSAHMSNIKNFVRTLNSSVGEQLWGWSLRNDKNGDISYLGNIDQWIKPIKEINGTSINVSNCNDPTQYKTIAETKSEYTNGITYYIQCKDGTATSAPYFRLINQDGKIIYERN